ncbi:Na+/H+ antiporter subunit G [Palleronia sediminis]|uniref:Na+/H+ antiporter subunit G n=1 Tax=Palleronia sediminis TaxID=2547833 RepID=A0A4R6AB15_9RHOB|nr:Na+/H+ antiporter subunit G [Palleronia sediminis]TDL81131.1 Na+/H+ antiporter subunit G [Palleronia sediminis]
MILQAILEWATVIALLLGAMFTIVGSYGLLKLDDPMKRLHAPTKAATMGVGSLLAAAMLHEAAAGEVSVNEILIMVFLFLTAPISANFIAKVAIHGRTCDRPPAPSPDEVWGTNDVELEDIPEPKA